MDVLEAAKTRHAVRSYTNQKIEGEVLAELQNTITKCNKESGLNIQLVLNEPTAFTSMMARYGKFNNVKNYLALVGEKSDMLEEKCGYYGQKIVLRAQQLGLNTCWVALTFSKSKSKSAIDIEPGQKLLLVISLGYGETQGTPHKNKPLEELGNVSPESPEWFRDGVVCAQLAPTASNQQKFRFELSGDTVNASAGSGFYTKVDLGIAKYHFEIGANGYRFSV